jgi:hypothetical protein
MIYISILRKKKTMDIKQLFDNQINRASRDKLKELIAAILDTTDGVYDNFELSHKLGLSLERSQKILDIRDECLSNKVSQ